jgi:Mg/Co/Ni transporter MgtE
MAVGPWLTVGALDFSPGPLGEDATIGLIVFLTISTTLIVTNLLGAGVPFVVSRTGRDPAVASGPHIMSVADTAGLRICAA